MITWDKFENQLLNKPYITIDNASRKSIVLFGNCHIATIGYFLNYLTNYQYNIHIIISWYCDKSGLEKFNMIEINNQIFSFLGNCDILIFQKHIKNYGVNATNIDTIANKLALKIQIPNLRLDYNINDESKYKRSLEILDYNIANSDFPDFMFLLNYKNIHFFNTPEHPTHYVLYLLSKYAYFKILGLKKTINIADYYSIENRNDYKSIKKYVYLPGKILINEDMSRITGILINAECFD